MKGHGPNEHVFLARSKPGFALKNELHVLLIGHSIFRLILWFFVFHVMSFNRPVT